MKSFSVEHMHDGGRFFDNSRMLRFFILFLLSVFLLLFIHNREVRVPLFEQGTIASRYVVAEVPFSFVDEEATAAVRHAAGLDIGKILEINPEEVLRRQLEFENSLISDQWWRIMAPQATLVEMCHASDRLGQVLLEVRFSDVRTIERMKQAGIDISCFHESAPIDLRQGICLTDKMWEFIRRKAFTADLEFQPKTTEFIISYFRDKIWKLRTDTALTRKVRKHLRQQVPVRYTAVSAGTRIIDSGEKVSSRHVTKLMAMKRALAEQRNLWYPGTVLGSLLLTGLILVICRLFLHCYHPAILASNSMLFLISTILLLTLVGAKILEFLLLRTTHGIADLVHYPLLTPFAGILLCILIGPSVAIFFVAVLSVMFNSCLAFEFQGLLFQNLFVGFMVIFFTRTLRRRTEIITVSLRGWLTACVISLSFYLYGGEMCGMTLFADIGGSGIFMLFTAVAVVGLLPLFESCFRILTDINLMEYMNPNHELLQRLMIEAPGTYQHSLLVGSISEAAAQSIGGNGLFCRVATLYHDVGKIPTAQYFTENQQSGMNIHQLLTPSESARVIISHVQEGVNLARRAGLPEAFIDMIREHHGTSLVYYFYHKQLEAVGHDPSKIDEREFRYVGPKPRSKEAAILMIADSFEAACRSIDEVSEESLLRLIDQIVREKVDDGQFSECTMSFEELERVKKAMVKALMSIGHFRIKYPAKIRLKASPA